ncbi:MAG: DUF4416 family protein [Calditrichaeota bacterium]|nr:MAG: DUF4416 family protein [Calditrichota bacterium]
MLVKYIVAITFREAPVLTQVQKGLAEEFGTMDVKSPAFVFDHTRYYEKEMGCNLSKQFVSFTQLFPREALVSWKRKTMEIEARFSKNGRRQANIDPAYMELAKLVVASSKNFDHRIYLGDGVYGDVQLRFRGGRFVANEWTYPDYRSEVALDFFHQVRTIYQTQLKHA